MAKTAAISAINHSGELNPNIPTLLRDSNPRDINALATVRTSENWMGIQILLTSSNNCF